MIIDLEPVFNNEGARLPFAFEQDLSDLEFLAERPFTEPVRVSGEVINQTGIVKLSIRADLSAMLPCDRCAADLRFEKRIETEHVLVTQLNDETNDDFFLLDGFRLDLNPLVHEDIVLSLPGKVLCSPDCRGLCTTCGANLNTGQCSCKKPTDPRLEALQQLLDN